MHRKTYAKIDLSNLKYNIGLLKEKLKAYDCHIAVVKADCYGHYGNEVVKAIIQGGCNYVAVSSLEEGLIIRSEIKEIPILCLGIIDLDSIKTCIEENITITISNKEYAQKLAKMDIKGLKVHLKVNTGMNRLGFSSSLEIKEVYDLLCDKMAIEGIFTHIYQATHNERTLKQVSEFERITELLDLTRFKIVHFGGSNYSLNYPKKEYINGVRFGYAMYGLAETKLPLKSTFSLHTKIIQINEIENATLGYDATYEIKDKEYIAVLPIGYADGIIRKNSGRYVYLGDKKCPIVGRICMDMLYIKVDKNAKVGDEVIIIKDNAHIREIADYLETNVYEVICLISKRVPRIYI